VVQRRQDGSVELNRSMKMDLASWTESPPLSHWSRWLGNDNIYIHQVSLLLHYKELMVSSDHDIN